MTLEQLKQEENELLQRLSENRKLQSEINRNLFAEKTGIKVGSLIEWPDGKVTKRGIVSRTKTGSFPVYAHALKKDGTPGSRETWVYCDVEKIKVIQQ